MKAHQMRRDMDMNLQALRFQHGAGKGAHRALAIGTGDVNDRRQAQLRIAQRRQQPQNPVQRQIDLFGMQHQKAL